MYVCTGTILNKYDFILLLYVSNRKYFGIFIHIGPPKKHPGVPEVLKQDKIRYYITTVYTVLLIVLNIRARIFQYSQMPQGKHTRY